MKRQEKPKSFGQWKSKLDEQKTRMQEQLQEARQRQSRTFSGGALTEVQPEEKEEQAPQAALASLSPAQRRKLSEMDSEIRHSVVEACFYNLKLLVQLLPEKHHQPGFIERLEPLLDEIPRVSERLEKYFSSEAGRWMIASLFPGNSRQVKFLVGAILAALPEDLEHLQAEEQAKKVAREVPEKIDAVMAELGAIKQELDQQKIAPAEVLQQALAIQEAALQEAGVKMQKSQDAKAASVRLHADQRQLLDVFVELLRNCVEHAFPEDFEGEKVLEIDLKMKSNGGSVWEVQFKDNGCGSHSSEHKKDSSHSGKGLETARQIIQDLHGGRFKTEAANGGFKAMIELPA
jgi:two-component sensor histidine kinase